MLSTIVVGFDGSPRGEDAIELGGLLARVADARLIAASVYSYPALSEEGDALARLLRQDAEAIAAQAVRMCPEPAAEAIAVEAATPSHGLQRVAEEQAADLVVVGSSHRGPLGRMLPGSVPECLLHDAGRAVAVAPAGYVTGEPPRLRSIGVGFDGGIESHAALDLAVDLARRSGAQLRVIGVIGTRLGGLVPGSAAGLRHAEYLKAVEDRERQAVMDAVAELRDVNAVAEPRLDGPVASLTARSHELDLLVLGSHGYGALRRLLHGSVSTALVRAAACPLLVVPRPPRADVPEAALTRPRSEDAHAGEPAGDGARQPGR